VGWRLLTRTGLTAMTGVAAAGLVAFVFLITAQGGRPFVVAGHVGLGGAVFLAGRFAIAAAHETAHGFALTACGRRVREAGLKLVLIFPYVYVDTSEGWLEPARRRIAISGAGPASDLVLGGAFALMCLASVPGAGRDILYQLAIGAYLGAAFNLNPFVERDGYQMLVDVLREPGLRGRARGALAGRLRGDRDVPPVLWRYGALGLAWSVVAGGLVVAVSVRTAESLRATLPDGLVASGLVLVCGLLSASVVLPVARLLRGRRRAAGA
jgi:putative peptide zinc metalloprotease protein